MIKSEEVEQIQWDLVGWKKKIPRKGKESTQRLTRVFTPSSLSFLPESLHLPFPYPAMTITCQSISPLIETIPLEPHLDMCAMHPTYRSAALLAFNSFFDESETKVGGEVVETKEHGKRN